MFPGPGALPSHRTTEAGEDLPAYHQELLRARDVRQSEFEAGLGQSSATVDQRTTEPRKQPGLT